MLGVLVWLALFVPVVGCERARFVAIADSGANTADSRDASDAGGRDDTSDAQVADMRSDAIRICPAPTVFGCSMGGGGSCDPVCQTGACDWCGQKCSYVLTSGGDGIEPRCAPTGAGKFPQACAVTAAGTSEQRDDCAPGSICLPPIIGDPAAYCFGLCRSQADCAYGVVCGQRKLSAAGGLVAVCDPPYDQCGADGTCCDPTANTGCDAGRVCLLVSPDLGTGHSRTVCEFSYGDGRNGSPCASARDCQVKQTCVNNACQQVCGKAAECPNGGTCQSLGSEFGYCP